MHLKTLDVTQPETFKAVIDEIIDEAGPIDVLVNNAGIIRVGAFEDLSEQSIRDVMETNFFGPMLLTREVLPCMRKNNGGYIIMVSSLSGVAGLAGDVAYAGSKFALEGATEALRHEVDRWGIKIALIQAGLYRTNIFTPEQSADLILPADYPDGSPYSALVDAVVDGLRSKISAALNPGIVGELLVRIAASDGSQLRWPADELSRRVLGELFGKSDGDRDAFLRGAADLDWWSQGMSGP